MSEIPVITVDGPSGSGKGTISRLLAERLGWHFLDSGSLYRILALAALKQKLSLEDEDALAALAQQLDIRFVNNNPLLDPEIFLNNEEVSVELRTESCGNAASKVAALPKVRGALLQRQRDFQRAPGLVADGRDMGTTVFPEAKWKFFLTASAEERAKRRHKQLKEKGIDVSLTALVKSIAERDERDGSRTTSPLKPADEAVIVDTSEMSIDSVLDALLAHIKYD